jgi:hypothetical protein
MIDWQIEETNKMFYKEDKWYFSDFNIQSYLLPIINVGKEYIDEYNYTSFNTEDCKRIVGNLKYLLGLLETRSNGFICFDSLGNGIVQLKVMDIEACIDKPRTPQQSCEVCNIIRASLVE